jgi:hypothetical protein
MFRRSSLRSEPRTPGVFFQGVLCNSSVAQWRKRAKRSQLSISLMRLRKSCAGCNLPRESHEFTLAHHTFGRYLRDTLRST